MPEWASKGRNVKSGPGRGTAGAADGHERAKDFLTAAELAGLLEAAKAGRHGTRDHLLLMMIFRHGLRVSEAVSLRLDELDLDRSMLWVHRLKGGLSVQQPIAGDELRAIRRYLAVRRGDLPWLFHPNGASRLPGRPSATLWAPQPHAPAWLASTRTLCAIPAATTSPTRVTTCASSRTTLATATPSIPSTTPARRAGASKGCGGD